MPFLEINPCVILNIILIFEFYLFRYINLGNTKNKPDFEFYH